MFNIGIKNCNEIKNYTRSDAETSVHHIGHTFAVEITFDRNLIKTLPKLDLYWYEASNISNGDSKVPKASEFTDMYAKFPDSPYFTQFTQELQDFNRGGKGDKLIIKDNPGVPQYNDDCNKYFGNNNARWLNIIVVAKLTTKAATLTKYVQFYQIIKVTDSKLPKLVGEAHYTKKGIIISDNDVNKFIGALTKKIQNKDQCTDGPVTVNS